MPTGGYIPSLDGLRAVSIAIVFFAHAGLSPLIPGGFGVTVFFFLSGFLISTLLVQEYDRHGSIALGAFYMRRLVRLGPPLVITLAAAAALVYAGLAEGDLSLGALVSQLFFYNNYYQLQPNPDVFVEGLAILWSLSVEEHFYLIYPAVFLAFARGWIGLKSVVLMLALILAWRAFRFYVFIDSEWELYISTDTRIDSMLYGCLLALMNAKGQTPRIFQDRFMYPLLGIAIVALLFSFAFQDITFRSTIRYSLQGIALMPLFYFAVIRHDLWLFRPLNWKPVRKIGQYSYTLYLAHYVIIFALIHNGLDQSNKIMFIPIAAAISIAFAALVYYAAERPMKPLRARLTGH